jgi:hypothetical protein
MDERDFEGALVLEQLAAISRVDDFFDAIDSDDVPRAASLSNLMACLKSRQTCRGPWHAVECGGHAVGGHAATD